MATDQQSITDDKLWRLVSGLRWRAPHLDAPPVLEQRWYCSETSESEWRAVPIEVVQP